MDLFKHPDQYSPGSDTLLTRLRLGMYQGSPAIALHYANGDGVVFKLQGELEPEIKTLILEVVEPE